MISYYQNKWQLSTEKYTISGSLLEAIYMSKKKMVSINPDVFKKIVKMKKMHLKDIIDANPNICYERTLFRSLQNKRMDPELLDKVALYLNVDPELLSGNLHSQADIVDDPYFKQLYLNSLTPENYPYFKKKIRKSENGKMRDALSKIFLMFEMDIKQYDELNEEEKCFFLRDFLESVGMVIQKYFSKDGYGNKKMPGFWKELVLLEGMIDDFEVDHYADTTVREKFIKCPPDGYTRKQIENMTPEQLISLDIKNAKEGE